jgi:hypothetical protein
MVEDHGEKEPFSVALERNVTKRESAAPSLDALLERIAASLERIAAALERRAATAVCSIEPAALSREDAARFLGVEEGTIDQLIRTRKLAYVQHGAQRGRVIPVAALLKFIEEHALDAIRELPQKKGRPGR